MINTVQWFIVNPVKIRLEIRKKEKIRMQKRNILVIFVGLIIGLYTVLGMSLFTFFNLKYHSVYYAQHIPHKEGTEPDIIMLMENNDWIYTPEIDGISYDDDGSYSITREKEREDDNAKKKYFRDFCRTIYRVGYSLRNEPIYLY